MAKAAKPRTTAREVHVLLADPGEKVTVILETALRQEGYKTHVARDSRVAYLKTLQLRPDAVIADLALPPEGAARLTATLRTNAVGRKSPVLIKGAPERPEVQDALRELGAAAVLSRPLRYGDLCKQLHAALRSAGKKPPGEKEAEAAGEAGAAPAGEPPEDEAVLRDPKALPSDKLQRVLDRASKLAAFPFVIARALAITEDDRSGAKDLAECVRSDPGLAGSILKIANTVHFASRGRSITDVGEAIVRVGFRETKRLVLAMPLLEMFPKEARNRAFDRVDFWLHSLAVGCIANQLARRSQYPHPEEAFITGLLHDVGKLVLDECFPRVFEEVLEKTLQGEGQTLEAERAIIGVGHPQIGAALMGRWNLPRSLQDALNLHHDLGRAKEGVGGTSLALVRIIALSDQIAKAVGVGGAGDRYLMEPDPSTWRAASLPTGLDTEGLKDVFRELNLFREFLNLGTTEIAPVRDTPARREGFILHVDERRRDASLLRLVLDSLGYQLLPLERRGETPARLVLVEATGGPERLAEYQALAEGAPGAPRLPLVIVSEDPYEVTEDARAHTASLGAAHDARTLERTLDGLILGENVQRAPAIDPEYLRSEEEALRGELASRLRAGPAPPACPAAPTSPDAADGPPRASATVPALVEPSGSSPGAAPTTTPPRAPGRAGGVPPLILVVDDEASVCEALQRVFLSGGYRVATADSGVVALQVMMREPPDLVLLDLRMPIMGGLEVLGTMRSEERLRRVPVLVLTADTQKESIRAAAALRVAGYLAKPADPRELLARAAKVVGARSSQKA